MYELSEAKGNFQKPTLINKIRKFIGYDLDMKPIFIDEQKKIEIPIIERIFMNENLKTKKAVTNLLSLINRLKEIYGDGFQLTDLFATAGLTPLMIEFLSGIKDIKEELPNLSHEQEKEILLELAKKGMPIIWTDNGIENRELGIENIKLLFKEITDIVEATLLALPNGIEITDVQYLPEVITSTLMMIKVSPQAFAEMKNLNAIESSDLLIDLIGKVFFIIRK